ncbi:MAG TPA: hypothetical protein VFB54_01105 [Burkholderiales bacterium]|nr:hypothetical protein [Burkholderiales bacterium]
MRKRWGKAALVSAAIMAALALGAGGLTPAFAAGRSVLAPADPTYVKECGSCHIAYSPELLPSRSWQRVMGGLADHFGESATVDAETQKRITDYLTAHAAEKGTNEQSVQIMRSLRADETPLRITQVPYIAGLHAAALEDLRGGTPRPHTLAECGVCHYKVQAGNYTDRQYSVTDIGWRDQANVRH